MKKITLLLLLSFSICLCFAQEQSISSKEWTWAVTDIDIDFLTCGPRFYIQKSTNQIHSHYNSDNEYINAYKYRMSFVVSEIYYGILIEKISTGLSEEDERVIESKRYYSGFGIGDKITDMGRLTGLEFIKWPKYNEIYLKEYDQNFKIIINEDNTIVVKKVKNVP